MNSVRSLALVAAAVAVAVVSPAPAAAQQAAPVAVARSAALPALTADQRAAAVAAIVGTVTDRYVFPERVPPIAARLNDSLVAGRYDTDQPAAFAERLSADLREASGDRHMYLNYAPDEYAATVGGDGGDRTALDALWARRTVRGAHGLARTELLPGNIRYLRIAGFLWVDDQTGVAYDAAMRFLRDGDAVIVDIRGNGGGSHAAVRYLLSHFMDGDQLDITFLQAGEAPIQSRTLEYLPAGRMKGKPLYVLIDRNTGSAAEAFAYDVQQFRLGVLVGQTTGGAANNNEFSPVPPGFMLSVSSGRPVHPVSETNWEGVGVAPDVAVDPDLALATAQSLALETLLGRADAAPADRADWEWARVDAEARRNPVSMPAARLRSLVGTYGVHRITYEQGRLVWVRSNGRTARLSPMTADGLFSVEGYSDRLRLRLDGQSLETHWIDEPSPTRFPRG
jgi:hypothetical protein